MESILKHYCTARHRCDILLKAKKVLDKNPRSKFRRLVVDLICAYCAVLKSLDGSNKPRL